MTKWQGLRLHEYRPERITPDIILGSLSGVETMLWSCTFAAMIFAGHLSVYLPVAIVVMLLSSALITGVVGATSSHSFHIAVIDEQTVAIMAAVGAAANAQWDSFATPGEAASTLFAIMATIAILAGISLRTASRFDVGHLIQLLPFPVVCGFLAGLGWLLFDAAIALLTDFSLTRETIPKLFVDGMALRWAPAVAVGLTLFVLARLWHNVLLLPGILLLATAGFYFVATGHGMTLSALHAEGWVFSFETGQAARFSDLSLASVNMPFLTSVLPEIATAVVLNVIGVSLNLSALEVGARKVLPLKHELRSLGTANIASGLVMGAPGVTDIVGSVMYPKIGASSRLFPLLVAAICATAAATGGSLLEYVPKAAAAAMVIFMAFNLFFDWLIEIRYRMPLPERVVVWSIFGTIVVIGFMPGVVLGILLTSLLFVVRYSRIDIIEGMFSLSELSSSVERSAGKVRFLRQRSASARIFNLRGFLFFGSASRLYERIKRETEVNKDLAHVVLNFHRVTGMDSTAAQILTKIVTLLEGAGIETIVCGLTAPIRTVLDHAEGLDGESFQVVANLDLSLKRIEDKVLISQAELSDHESIQEVLAEIVGDPIKGGWLAEVMERLEVGEGEYLFRQGDQDTCLYVIERGAIEVQLQTPKGVKRLREFSRGTVIGEMAAYSGEKTRSASAQAMVPSIVYRLPPEKLATLGEDRFRLIEPVLHEFVARLVISRLIFMNRRMQFENA